MASVYSPFAFLVGAPRSGTTLLRLMMDANPQMAIPPETGFLPRAAALRLPLLRRQRLLHRMTHTPLQAPTWPDFGLSAEDLRRVFAGVSPFTVSEGVRAFYRMYAQKHGKPRFGDKTPLYALQMPLIERLLPEARFIHVIRDGRDVALSLRKTWFAPSQEVSQLARYWGRIVRQARHDGNRVRSYMEVRFEEIVTQPEQVLPRICSFLDLPYDPAMLLYWKRAPERLQEHKTRQRIDGSIVVHHHQRLKQQELTMQPPRKDRIGVWREAMSPEEVESFNREAGNLLRELGYSDQI